MAEPHLCMWGNTREWKMGLRGPWEDAEAGNQNKQKNPQPSCATEAANDI